MLCCSSVWLRRIVIFFYLNKDRKGPCGKIEMKDLEIYAFSKRRKCLRVTEVDQERLWTLHFLSSRFFPLVD